MTRSCWPVAFALVLAGGMGGCAPPGPEPQAVVLTGAEAMAPLMRDVATRFEAAHAGVRITVQAAGSERGLIDARTGLADVGMVARPLRPAESALYAVPVARDGLGILVHRCNPVTSLTRTEVRQIYTRAIDRWVQVGGSDRAITLVVQGEGKQPLPSFLALFHLRPPQVRPDVRVRDAQQAVQAVVEQPQAVAFASVGPGEESVAAGAPVRLLALDGVSATLDNVADGSYPAVRPLNLVTRDPPAGAVRAFIDFACSPQVADLIRKYHYCQPAGAAPSPRRLICEEDAGNR